VYKFYGEELREMFGYEEHPYGFYTMAGMTGGIFRSRTIFVRILCSLLLLLIFTSLFVCSFSDCFGGFALWFLHCYNMWTKDQ
jgi:hypothetical protein